MFVAPEGQAVTDPAFTAAIEQTLAAAAEVDQVGTVLSPFDTLSLSADGRAALAQVRFDVSPSCWPTTRSTPW